MINFYALLSRMKYIERWSLMRNTSAENLSEHSYDVAVLVHALALLDAQILSADPSSVERPADPGVCVLLALYHDVPEIFTGDLPTPVKYANPAIREAVRQVESTASERLLALLPETLRETYEPLLTGDAWPRERKLVKAADKLSALIKCIEEAKQGNREFDAARRTIEAELYENPLPSVRAFLEQCLPAYSLSLDELTAL